MPVMMHQALDSKNEEEGVVLFEEARLVLVMVPVEIPHGTVHQVFVGSPSHAFHGQEGGENDEGGDQDVHGNKRSPMKKAVCTKSNRPPARLVLKDRLRDPPQSQARRKAMTHQAA